MEMNEQPGPSERRLLTIDQLSTYISVCKPTVYNWTHQGKIPHLKLGKSLRFDKAEIDRWLESKRVKLNRFEQVDH